ncbi:PAS domain-containing protein [Streptomyces sp. M19]
MAAARHRDGRRIDIGTRVSALTGEDGAVRYLVSAVDLTRIPSWAVNEKVMEAFLTRSPLGMAVFDTELRYLWLNPTLERFGGVPRAERLGRRMRDVLPHLNTAAVEGQMRRVLETGAPVIDFEHQGAPPPSRTARVPTPRPSSGWRTPTTSRWACAPWSWTSATGGRPGPGWRCSTRRARRSAVRSTSCAPPRSWPTSPYRASRTSSPSTWWRVLRGEERRSGVRGAARVPPGRAAVGPRGQPGVRGRPRRARHRLPSRPPAARTSSAGRCWSRG